MQTLTHQDVVAHYLDWWNTHTQQSGRIHNQLLDLRQNEMHHLAGLIGQQVRAYQHPNACQPEALYDLTDLQEFASGSIVKCLGQEYAVYSGRRSPRLPNGDLLLISRIMSIQGQKGQFNHPSSITAEYDIPAEAWYFDGETNGQLPFSIWLEIALQPCGFLTAYLGTPLRFPDIDFYFRNLDGQCRFTRQFDARGKTIQTRATLLKTVFSGSTILQHYSFELLCEGMVFFQGLTSFGYFPGDALMSQEGLDGGQPSAPWLQQSGIATNLQLAPIAGTALETGLPKGKLRLINSVLIDKVGGKHKEGYVYSSQKNFADNWYYACHFYQDPVMPGSLGIEAVIQAMKIFAQQQSPTGAAPTIAIGHEITWKYRGQVLQHHQQMQVEVHFRNSERIGSTRLFTGDASLWADDMRIYEISPIALTMQEN